MKEGLDQADCDWFQLHLGQVEIVEAFHLDFLILAVVGARIPIGAHRMQGVEPEEAYEA